MTFSPDALVIIMDEGKVMDRIPVQTRTHAFNVAMQQLRKGHTIAFSVALIGEFEAMDHD